MYNNRDFTDLFLVCILNESHTPIEIEGMTYNFIKPWAISMVIDKLEQGNHWLHYHQ